MQNKNLNNTFLSFQTWRLLCFRASKFPLVIIAVRVFIWQTIKIKARMQPSSSGRSPACTESVGRLDKCDLHFSKPTMQSAHICDVCQTMARRKFPRGETLFDRVWSFYAPAANTSRLALTQKNRAPRNKRAVDAAPSEFWLALLLIARWGAKKVSGSTTAGAVSQPSGSRFGI